MATEPGYISTAPAVPSDPQMLSEFMIAKYEKEARKNWDLFYKRNKTNFFKDRHYLHREFVELAPPPTPESGATPRTVVLEIGCGVGNSFFPLLSINPSLFFYALDFSPRAIAHVKEHIEYDETRIKAYVCDPTQEPLPAEIPAGRVDHVLFVFVLSAISPEMMTVVLRKAFDVLRPGGTVLFRDYAQTDLAQARFEKEDHKKAKLGENFYVRWDGTRAYYFSEEFLVDLFAQCGFVAQGVEICKREIVNRAKQLQMDRAWIQARFKKPETGAAAGPALS